MYTSSISFGYRFGLLTTLCVCLSGAATLAYIHLVLEVRSHSELSRELSIRVQTVASLIRADWSQHENSLDWNRARHTLSAARDLDVIIHEREGDRIGVVVNEILDIVEGAFELSATRGAHESGPALMVGSHVVELVDLDAVVHRYRDKEQEASRLEPLG